MLTWKVFRENCVRFLNDWAFSDYEDYDWAFSDYDIFAEKMIFLLHDRLINYKHAVSVFLLKSVESVEKLFLLLYEFIFDKINFWGMNDILSR